MVELNNRNGKGTGKNGNTSAVSSFRLIIASYLLSIINFYNRLLLSPTTRYYSYLKVSNFLSAVSYFPPLATQEILDELRPMLCPSDAKAMKFGVQMLSWFLPLTSSPELANSTYKLWLDEMLRLWDACSNNAVNWEDVSVRLKFRLIETIVL